MSYWWTSKPKDLHSDVVGDCEFLSDRHRIWNSRIETSVLIYNNKSGQYGMFESTLDPTLGFQERCRWNVSASCVDTLVSKIGVQKPRPKFVTQGGNWDQRSIARKCDKFVEGIYHQEHVYDKAQDAFWDCLVAGLGALKVYACEGEIKVERVYPGEILVDDQLSQSQFPRSMFQVKQVPVELLVGQYPKYKKVIEDSKDLQQDKKYSIGRVITIDTVKVYEGWHLAPNKDECGRHCICVNKGTLLDEEYEPSDFPFVFLWSSLNPNGFYKQSLIEQMRPLQSELNKISQRIQESADLLATTWICIEDGSVEEEHLTNMPATILKYRQGTSPPSVIAPQVMSGQVFEYQNSIYQRMYEISGVSQLSASAKKPAEIESGKAMRTLTDIEAGRFSPLAKMYENAIGVELAYRIMTCAAEAYEDEMEVKSIYDAKNFVETIDWKEICEIDKFVIKAYPVNFLSETPSGKIADLEQLIGMGLISDPKIAAMYLDFPDMENLNDIESASVENTDRIIDAALYESEYYPPRPYTNFAIAIPRVSAALQRAETEGCPEDRLDLLRQWLLEATQLQAPPPPPTQPQQSPGEMPPPGAEAGLPGASPLPQSLTENVRPDIVHLTPGGGMPSEPGM